MVAPISDIPPLSIQALTCRYGDTTALDEVSLQVERGEIVGLLGPNGAGKTTLFEVIEGVQRASTGEAMLFGHPPRSIPPHVRAATGFVFQRNALPDHVRVSQLLTLYKRIHGSIERIDQLAQRLGLAHLTTRVVGELSVGQRQRLSVFTALAGSPSLILMDEPTAALDPRSRRAVWDVVLGMKRDGPLSGLIATHDMTEAQTLCDRIIFIDGGRLCGALQTNEALETPHLSFSFWAPGEIFDTHRVFKDLSFDASPGMNHYRLDCPKEQAPHLVAAIISAERAMVFDARLELGQRSLEAAYFEHVATPN
jgi:ABC-type multidrug transport system ATPase subunit